MLQIGCALARSPIMKARGKEIPHHKERTMTIPAVLLVDLKDFGTIADELGYHYKAPFHQLLAQHPIRFIKEFCEACEIWHYC